MAKDLFVDVTADVRLDELQRAADPTREMFELLRAKADVECRRVGARLRTDRAPEIHLRDAMHPGGWGVLLVASRWAVVAPDRVEVAF